MMKHIIDYPKLHPWTETAASEWVGGPLAAGLLVRWRIDASHYLVAFGQSFEHFSGNAVADAHLDLDRLEVGFAVQQVHSANHLPFGSWTPSRAALSSATTLATAATATLGTVRARRARGIGPGFYCGGAGVCFHFHRSRFGRAETQGHVRNLQGIFSLGDHNCNSRGHAGL